MDHIFLTIKIIYRCTLTYINACCYIHVFQRFSLKYEFLGDSNKTMMREDQEIIYWEQSKGKSNIIKGEKKRNFILWAQAEMFEKNTLREKCNELYNFQFSVERKKNCCSPDDINFFFPWHSSWRKIYIQTLYSL